MSNIVKVNTNIEPSTLKYTVFVNADLESIRDYCQDNRNVYVLPFYTGSVEQVPDFSDVWGDKDFLRVCTPYWLGGNENQCHQMQQVIKMLLNEDDPNSKWEMV